MAIEYNYTVQEYSSRRIIMLLLTPQTFFMIMLDIKKLTKNKRKEKNTIQKDNGISCIHRVITNNPNMICRLHNFQSNKYCTDCRDKQIPKELK